VAFAGSLVFYEPNALVTLPYEWESAIVWRYARLGSSHVVAGLTKLSVGRQDVTHSAVGACYISVDCKSSFVRPARVAELLFPSPGHLSLLIVQINLLDEIKWMIERVAIFPRRLCVSLGLVRWMS
jgi:hypothetical protein